MELEVLNPRGIPKSSVLSISVGGTRRQVNLSQIDRPLLFPRPEDDISGIKVDVLDVLGHIRVPYQASQEKYSVPIDVVDGARGVIPVEPMQVDLRVRQVASPEPSSPSKDDAKAREIAACNYLGEHGLVNYMEFLLSSLMQDKPADPYVYLQRQIAIKMGKSIVAEDSSNVDFLIDRLSPTAASRSSPTEISKLEKEAVQASERLRKDNAKLRDKAGQMKGEYEKLMKESSFLHGKLEAKQAAKEAIKHPTVLPFGKYYGRFIGQQCRPYYWNKLHKNFNSRIEPSGTAANTKAAYREIEKLQEEVAALARENAKLVADLARGREMIELVRRDIDDIRRSVETDA